MSTLKGLIVGNWPLKLTALLLASTLYTGLALSESTRSWSGPVPVEVLDAPAGVALLDNPGVVDRIEFRASDEVADTLTNDSFRASIDLSGVEPRPGAEPIEVPVDVFPVDPRVRVVDYSPPGVTIRLDQVVSRVMPVTADHGPLPDGIELGPVIVEPNQVTLSGASSRLQNVRNVDGRFVVDGSGLNIDEVVAVQAFDEVGALVPGIDVDPGSVRVRADVARQLAYATLPVVAELTGEPTRGHRVDDVSVLPSAVTVSGENAVIRSLEAIATEPLDISGGETELVRDVPLVLPDEVTSPGQESVTVIVSFTDAIGSRSYEIGTALTGARPDLTYRLGEPAVSVVVSGPVTQLDEIDVAELIAQVPVAQLEVGDNAVMPIVRTPRGTSVTRVTPETVSVAVAEPS